MHAKDAEEIIFRLLKSQKSYDLKDWKRATLDQISRSLRESDLLPSGSRGVFAPQLTEDHLANLIIAFAGSERPADAAKAVSTYSPLRTRDYDFDTTFGAFLASALSNPFFAETIDAVTVSRSFARAIVRFDKNKTLVFAAEGMPKEGGLVSNDFTLSGGFISQLALEAAEASIPKVEIKSWGQSRKDEVDAFKKKMATMGVEFPQERPIESARGGWGPPPISPELKQQLQKLGSNDE